jgi:NAD(P)H-hydrate epimerase
VWVVLDRAPESLGEAAANQLRILRAAGVEPLAPDWAEEAVRQAQLVVDALIGYSLRGAPRGRAAELIELCNRHAARVLSLDVPSGLDATTGQVPGVVVHPQRTVTLALPKTGLHSLPGDLYLADIGIPPGLYARLGLSLASIFGRRYWVRLEPSVA